MENQINEQKTDLKKNPQKYSGTIKINFTKIVQEAKSKSGDNKYDWIIGEFLSNFVLLSPICGMSNKVNCLTLISYYKYNQKKKNDVLFLVQKVLNLIEKEKGIDAYFFIRTLYRGALLKSEIDNDVFYAYYFIDTASKTLKNATSIGREAKRLLSENINTTWTNIIEFCKKKKNFFKNSQNFENFEKIQKLLDNLINNIITVNNNEISYMINADWVKKAKIFIDSFMLKKQKEEFDSFMELSFNENNMIQYYFDLYKSKDPAVIEKYESAGIYPGIINNFPLTKYKVQWMDPDPNCQYMENVFIKDKLELGINYYLINEEDWKLLNDAFSCTNIIQRKKDEIYYKKFKSMIYFPLDDNLNIGMMSLKYIQVSKNLTYLDFKKNIMKRVLYNCKANKEFFDDKTKKKNIKKNNDDSDEEYDDEEEKKDEENEEDKEKETNDGNKATRKPSENDTLTETATEASSTIEKDIFAQYNIHLYSLHKKHKEYLNQLNLAHYNKMNSFNVPVKEIEYNDSSTIENLDLQPNSYLVIEITKKTKESIPLILPSTNFCSFCKKDLSKLESIYECDYCSYGQYCSKKCAESDDNHVKFDKSMSQFLVESFDLNKLFSIPIETVFTRGEPHGLVGLYNLGNTCYMNSALQCLSNSEDLVKYFLLNKYNQEINLGNRLGSQGHLVKAFHNLLLALWKTPRQVVDPSGFRNAFASKFHHFGTFEQQDSQEMLSLLLDNLHEDLNRINNKPYFELKEQQEGETEQQASERWWTCHKKREDSIIVDLFHGQLKSTIDCPKCLRKNITYDPFMFLSLLLPSEFATIKLKCFYLNPQKSLVCEIYETPIFINSTVKALKSQFQSKITTISGIPEAVLFDKDKMILSILQDEEKIYKYFDNGQEICIYEKESLDCFNIYIYPVIIKDEPGIIWGRKKRIVYLSYPIPLSVNGATTLGAINIQIRNVIRENFESECLRKIPEDKLTKIYIYHNTLSGGFSFFSKSACEFCNNKTSNSFCELFDNGLNESTPMTAIMAKMKNNRPNIFLCDSSYYDVSKSFYIGLDLYLSKYITSANLIKRNDNVTLYDLLDFFQCQEKLEKDNSWYCDRCKKHQEAIKKTDIYRAPNYLIIHLKRFKIRTNNSMTAWVTNSKIKTFIDYPVENLDITKYIIGPKNGKAIYDLYGVVQHFGGLNGGHYTALAKNMGKWYDFNDESVSYAEKVVNSSAYLLFYKRKDLNKTN